MTPHPGQTSQLAPDSQATPAMTPPSVVRCASCGQANRLPGENATARCGRCKSTLPEQNQPLVITDGTLEKIITTNKRVVIDFWAAWCGPCRQIAPLVEALAAERVDVLFSKLDVDQNKGSSARFRVSGIPTLLFFVDGREAGRVVGAVGRSQLEKALQQYFPHPVGTTR